MKKPLIIFDFDGTIVDSMDLCINEIRHTLRELDIPCSLSDEEIGLKGNGPTNEESAELLGIPEEKKQRYLTRRLEYNMLLLPEYQRLFPHIPEMLEHAGKVAELAIASNGVDDYIFESCRLMKLEKYFSHISSSSSGLDKTHQIEKLLLEEAPAKAIMVGDRVSDIVSGKLNGLPTICAAYGYGTESEWLQADDIAHNADELADKLCAFCAGSIEAI